MSRANADIRKQMLDAGVRQWQIAEKLNVSEFTLSRWFRHELPADKKEKVAIAIREIDDDHTDIYCFGSPGACRSQCKTG